jgi:hypothetical protein
MNDSESHLKEQQVAFYFALFNLIGLELWVSGRAYFYLIGDTKGDRAFTHNTFAMFPFWVLSWIIAFIIVGNSILKYQRISWFGIGALGMLTIPAIPVAALTFITWWKFLNSP